MRALRRCILIRLRAGVCDITNVHLCLARDLPVTTAELFPTRRISNVAGGYHLGA
jgi:hypothetical protein